ncbi:MAG: hypothetical protein VX046_00820 [Bacteroidota bacterium]|nr:hypothetical protein [Bacteroidota bacterium]
MDKKQIFIGMLLGFAANTLGLFTVGLLMAKFSGRNDRVYKVRQAAGSENFIGKLISLGAIMNLLVFFYCLKKQQDTRAAGVLAATVLIALFTFFIKL